MSRVQIEPIQPHETALWSAYQEAIKGAITAADSAADKILTAAFSIATAYGALVGLVAPKEKPSGVLVGAPFGVLGAAAIGAMLALTRSMEPAGESTLSVLVSAVKDKLKWKRVWLGTAVFLLAGAVSLAGYVVVHLYAPAKAPTKETVTATVQLVASPQGIDVLTGACPLASAGSLVGEVHTDTLDQRLIEIDAAAGKCQAQATTIRLPQGAVSIIFGNP